MLYIWAQDQAHVAPDFLAVVNFDEESSKYQPVVRQAAVMLAEERPFLLPLPIEPFRYYPPERGSNSKTPKRTTRGEWEWDSIAKGGFNLLHGVTPTDNSRKVNHFRCHLRLSDMSSIEY